MEYCTRRGSVAQGGQEQPAHELGSAATASAGPSAASAGSSLRSSESDPHSKCLWDALDRLLHSLQATSSAQASAARHPHHVQLDSAHDTASTSYSPRQPDQLAPRTATAGQPTAHELSSPPDMPLPASSIGCVNRCLDLLRSHPGRLTARWSTVVSLYANHTPLAEALIGSIGETWRQWQKVGTVELFVLGSVASAGKAQWEAVLNAVPFMRCDSSNRSEAGGGSVMPDSGCAAAGSISASAWRDLWVAAAPSQPAMSWLMSAVVVKVEMGRYGRAKSATAGTKDMPFSAVPDWQACVAAVAGHLLAVGDDWDHNSSSGIGSRGAPESGNGSRAVKAHWILQLALRAAAYGPPAGWLSSKSHALQVGLLQAHSCAVATACSEMRSSATTLLPADRSLPGGC